jgi:RNA polymerase sigma-70 factor (ECF subfamily)
VASASDWIGIGIHLFGINMSDLDRLVQDCRQGSLAAFGELFDTLQARVYRLAATILRDEHDAEDIVQDVFLYVFGHINDFRGEAAITTWLTAITVNRCRDKLRRRKVREALSLDRLREQACDETLSEITERRARRDLLWSLVDLLDDAHRLCVILRYQEGLSCDEVAQVMGLRVGTVYSRLHTARERLREMHQAGSEARDRKIERALCGRGLLESKT